MKKQLTAAELKSRIIARGEHSNHSHIIVGDAHVTTNKKGEIIVEVGNEGAILKHLMETDWLDGTEKWTGEHTDIDLSGLPDQVRHGDVMLEKISARSYKYVPQLEYDPYDDAIRQVKD